MDQPCLYMDHLNGPAVNHMSHKLHTNGSEVSRGMLTSEKTPPRWIQTDRASHEAWGRLSVSKPRAAGLMHYLVAQMGHSDAVVASWATLAGISGMSVATVRRAISDLRAERWIEVVQIGGKGAANAIVINSRVAWTQDRDKLRYARFSAEVLARSDEQVSIDLEPLRQIPSLLPGERQLPLGESEPPPSQPNLDGLEPDLPARNVRQIRQEEPAE
jgi:hypothetical protein